jgi:hypothetical protein
VNGKAGTCWPSIAQCQHCCDATLTNCGRPQGAAPPKATVNVAPSRPIQRPIFRYSPRRVSRPQRRERLDTALRVR